MLIKEQIKKDFEKYKDFENFEANDNYINLNVLYFIHGTTPIMQDFSEIAMEYIKNKLT